MSRPARLLDLVHLLAGRRSRPVSEIAERFGVSRRTVFRDLAELSERHIPLYRNEHGYRLLDTATLRPLNFTAEEHALLKVALHNPALRHQPTLRTTLDALEAKLDAASALVEETPHALQLAGVDRSGPKAEKAIQPLERTIASRRSVDIRYDSLSGGRHQWRRLDPWQLFQRSGAWYVVGHCHRNREPRIFRLDRISGIRRRQESYEIPSDFDLERFLEDAWSLVVGDRRWEIELRFDGSVGPLLLNARHHPGERVEELEDGTIRYRVTLSSLEEIAGWVLTFGGRCRIVKPAELLKRVRETARSVLQQKSQDKKRLVAPAPDSRSPC